MAGHDSIAEVLLVLHAEVSAAVFFEPVEFLEGAFVQEEFDALARGHLPGRVLPFYSLAPTALERRAVSLFQLPEPIARAL
jgi:hypothetical protein